MICGSYLFIIELVNMILVSYSFLLDNWSIKLVDPTSSLGIKAVLIYRKIKESRKRKLCLFTSNRLKLLKVVWNVNPLIGVCSILANSFDLFFYSPTSCQKIMKNFIYLEFEYWICFMRFRRLSYGLPLCFTAWTFVVDRLNLFWHLSVTLRL